jgi:hypothetical protein
MKARFFLYLMILGVIISCNQQKKSPIEDAWQLVYAKWSSMEESFPGQITGSGVKFWTDGCYTSAGNFHLDTLVMDNYGWGTYKLSEGTHYEESIIKHHYSPNSEGQTFKMLIEVRNDTLIQRWPADENWNLPQKYSTEKYIRLK